jgi:hypothetical protein
VAEAGADAHARVSAPRWEYGVAHRGGMRRPAVSCASTPQHFDWQTAPSKWVSTDSGTSTAMSARSRLANCVALRRESLQHNLPA